MEMIGWLPRRLHGQIGTRRFLDIEVGKSAENQSKSRNAHQSAEHSYVIAVGPGLKGRTEYKETGNRLEDAAARRTRRTMTGRGGAAEKTVRESRERYAWLQEDMSRPSGMQGGGLGTNNYICKAEMWAVRMSWKSGRMRREKGFGWRWNRVERR